MTGGTQSERSVAELFGKLASETGTLVRQEMKLAVTEVSQKAALVGWQSLNILVGALIAVVGLTWLLASAFIGLSHVIPSWAAALGVGGLATVAASAFIFTGVLALKRLDPTPRQTIQTLEESKTWAQKQIQ